LFILENVKGLLSHDNGNTFKTIIATLDELGYDLQWQVLNSKNFGVPQNRERVFIIGHLRGTSRPQVFLISEQSNPNTTESKSTKTAVARTLTGGGHSGGNHSGMTIIAKTVRVSRRGSPHGCKQNWDSYEFDGKIRRLTPTECERLQGFPDGWTGGVSDTQRYKCLGNAVTVNVVEYLVKSL
jgi:DNA (cytosine-5)-methyltransferase 1